jgi:hypothetical protein
MNKQKQTLECFEPETYVTSGPILTLSNGENILEKSIAGKQDKSEHIADDLLNNQNNIYNSLFFFK